MTIHSYSYSSSSRVKSDPGTAISASLDHFLFASLHLHCPVMTHHDFVLSDSTAVMSVSDCWLCPLHAIVLYCVSVMTWFR